MIDRFTHFTLLPETGRKYEALKQYLREMGSVAVGLSGGVDSSLLAYVCFEELGSRALAVTIVSPTFPQSELRDACKVASLIGIRHVLLEEKEMSPEVLQNPVNRCYFCKKVEFGKIVEEARRQGIAYVVDGSNSDDRIDYRPGFQALRELQVKSPLQEVKLNKKEIRELSTLFGLFTGEKPSFACLASRIPYGEALSLEKLKRIEQAESWLQSLGFREVRVRSHDQIARIEVAPEERDKLFDVQLLDRISKTLKAFGFSYVCMELEGYTMGSLNRRLRIRP